MQIFILTILSAISLMILFVIARELYHLAPGLKIELRKFEEMVALELLILTSIGFVTKFM